MIEAKITVDAPKLAEAINNLAKAITSDANATTYLAAVSKNVIAPKFAEAKDTAVAPAEVAPTPTTTPVQVAEATPEITQPIKTYTLDDLSRAGAELIDQGKMPQLIDLLKKNGVQAITQLKPDQYAAVATELIALGAKL